MTPLFTFVEPPAPFREDPSTLKVNFSKYFANFSRNCFFLTFFKTPISKVNCLVKLSVFSQCIIFEKVSKLKTLRGGRGFKCPGRLEKRKKAQFREKVANLTLKCTFEGSKVLAGGGQTLENRENLCHLTNPPISVLCEKLYFDTKCSI